MLELLNRYTHGLVAVPAIVVCRDGGVFAALQSEGPIEAADLAVRLNANEGHLRVALRLFESLAGSDFKRAAALSGAPPMRITSGFPRT